MRTTKPLLYAALLLIAASCTHTPKASELFNLIPGDIGRPLEHITHRFAPDGFTADAERTLRAELAAGGDWRKRGRRHAAAPPIRSRGPVPRGSSGGPPRSHSARNR